MKTRQGCFLLIVSSLAVSGDAFVANDQRLKGERSLEPSSTHSNQHQPWRHQSRTLRSSSTSQDNAKAETKISARYVAAMALMEPTAKNAKEEFSLRQLENNQQFHRLELRDRRFARNLVSTVERRKGQLDKVLALCMDRPFPKARRKSDALVQSALRIGAAQLLVLETPPHAAVKETVELLRMTKVKVPEPKIKFVNAVLRRMERERANNKDLIAAHSSPYDNIAPWLLEEWRTSWGEDRLASITEAAMAEAPVYISVNQQLGATEEEKSQTLHDIQQAFVDGAPADSTADTCAEILPHGSIQIDKASFPGAVSKWPLYEQGEWWVQDASATLPAIALYNSLLKDSDNPPKEQQTIVDLCAAPGGKTAQLLSLGFPKVTAVETSSRRAKQLQSNLRRLNLEDRCTRAVADGREWIPPEGPETASGVLLDVPCSATGTASRRPDVLRRDENLDSLLETQYGLAEHCVDNLLKPGGILVYATCSLLKQESEDQVRKLLDRKEQIRLLPFEEGEIPGFEKAIDELGCLRVIPGWPPEKHGSACDGFFVARFQKQ